MDAQLTSRLRIVALVAACGALPVSDAAAETRPRYGGTIQGSLLSEPSTFDPVRAQSHAEITLVSLVYDTLYRINDAGEAEPHLAAAMPEVSSNGKKVRIRIGAGIGFHDGSTLEATDVKKSLERLYKSRFRFLISYVRSFSTDGDELVLTLRRKVPDIAVYLASAHASITPNGKAPKGTNVVGSGPYKLAGFDTKRQRVTLSAARSHFAGRPYLDKLILRWFDDADDEADNYETGGAQLSFRGAVAFVGHQPKYATGKVEGPATILVYVGFGQAHATITSQTDFREALSLALGRDGFRRVGAGERVVPTLDAHPVDLGGTAITTKQRKSRVKEAKKALARAATSASELDDGDLSLELIIDKTRLDDVEIAEKVQNALYKIGVAVDIAELDAKTFAKRVSDGDCDLFIGQLASTVPTPVLGIAAGFAVGDDAWARKKLTSTDLSAKAARSEFAERWPIVPVFHRAVRLHHRKDVRVRGEVFDAVTRLSYQNMFMFGRVK